MTAKNLTKAQADALVLLRARLDWRSPAFRASDEVRKALEEARIYMDSWVFPLIEFIENGEQFHGHREYVMRDAASARRALTRHRLEMEPIDLAEREQFERMQK